MYVVITYPQTGGSPELGSWSLHQDLGDAQAERDDQQAQTNAVGRRERHVVAEVTPIESDDGPYHTGIRKFIDRHSRLREGSSIVAVMLAVADEIEGGDRV